MRWNSTFHSAPFASHAAREGPDRDPLAVQDPLVRPARDAGERGEDGAEDDERSADRVEALPVRCPALSLVPGEEEDDRDEQRDERDRSAVVDRRDDRLSELAWNGVRVIASPGRSVGKIATTTAATPASELRKLSQEKSRNL